MDQPRIRQPFTESGVALINLALSEEIESLNAIYGEGTLCVLNAKNGRIETRFCLPAMSLADRIAFHFFFPYSYPELPPEYSQADVDLHQSLDRRIQNISIIVSTSLRQVFVPGTVCIFDLIDFVLPILACMEGQVIDSNLASDFCPQVTNSDWRWTSRAFINMNNMRETVECYICCDEDFTYKMIQLPCDHHYCFDCFQTGWDLAAKALDPYTCCKDRIPLKVIREYTDITDEAALDYVAMLTDRDTPNPFYCGFKPCGVLIGAISVWHLSRGSTKSKGVKCPKCKQFTCPRCREVVHVGMCLTDKDMLELFQRVDIRRCMKCGNGIEKNGGCSHIQCRHCNTHYTWDSRGGLSKYDGPVYELNL